MESADIVAGEEAADGSLRAAMDIMLCISVNVEAREAEEREEGSIIIEMRIKILLRELSRDRLSMMDSNSCRNVSRSHQEVAEEQETSVDVEMDVEEKLEPEEEHKHQFNKLNDY